VGSGGGGGGGGGGGTGRPRGAGGGGGPGGGGGGGGGSTLAVGPRSGSARFERETAPAKRSVSSRLRSERFQSRIRNVHTIRWERARVDGLVEATPASPPPPPAENVRHRIRKQVVA